MSTENQIPTGMRAFTSDELVLAAVRAAGPHGAKIGRIAAAVGLNVRTTRLALYRLRRASVVTMLGMAETARWCPIEPRSTPSNLSTWSNSALSAEKLDAARDKMIADGTNQDGTLRIEPVVFERDRGLPRPH